jgi:hypothetical protein
MFLRAARCLGARPGCGHPARDRWGARHPGLTRHLGSDALHAHRIQLGQPGRAVHRLHHHRPAAAHATPVSTFSQQTYVALSTATTAGASGPAAFADVVSVVSRVVVAPLVVGLPDQGQVRCQLPRHRIWIGRTRVGAVWSPHHGSGGNRDGVGDLGTRWDGGGPICSPVRSWSPAAGGCSLQMRARNAARQLHTRGRRSNQRVRGTRRQKLHRFLTVRSPRREALVSLTCGECLQMRGPDGEGPWRGNPTGQPR